MKVLRFCCVLMGALTLTAGAVQAQQHPIRSTSDTGETASGLRYIFMQSGTGKQPTTGELAIVHYTGTLLDGSIFDSSRDREPFAFRLGKGQVIRGWDEGIALLRVGDRAMFIIPANLAYGERATASIPANATLIFDVELLDVKKKSVGDEIATALDKKKGVGEAWKRYRQLSKKQFDGYHLSEGELNMLGYKYLQAEKIEQAIAIFQMNVDAFPDSYNVYDSLGEAYMIHGENAMAIKYYNKSLALNPKNENAAEMLKKLNQTD